MYAIVDIETTGGNASIHRITEIAILIHDGKKIIDSYTSLINPQQYISPFITQLTGITAEMVENAPCFENVAGEIYSLLYDKIFVAHSAGFDYGFLRNMFTRHGYEFAAKKLCTVRLSKKIIPGHRSYSLGKICDALNIKIQNRHRALGDATATAELFSILLKNDTQNIFDAFLKRNSREHILPPQLDAETVKHLPEKPGVYYFHDSAGKIIYAGKAKNIRNRVLNHFNYAEHNGKENELREKISTVSYELTGNELIACLLESEEIKRKSPEFNYAQKLWDRNYCIFQYTDQLGYIHLAIERFNRKKEIIRVLPNYLSARDYLNEILDAHKLCARLCHLHNTKQACYNLQYGNCDGACVGSECAENYNQKVYAAIASCKDDMQTYFIFGKGRKENERSVVFVKNGHYLGFGFFDEVYNTENFDAIKQCIKWRPDTPDVQKILLSHLQKHPHEKIIIPDINTHAEYQTTELT